METKGQFRVQIRKWGEPYTEPALYYGEEPYVAPSVGEDIYIDKEDGGLEHYVVVKKETIISTRAGHRLYLMMIYVKEP